MYCKYIECFLFSFVSVLDGADDALLLFRVDGDLEDFRDDFRDPVFVFLALVVGSFSGEPDIDRASAHSLDSAILGGVGEENLCLNRLLNVDEGHVFNTLDLAGVAFAHLDSSDYGVHNNLDVLAVVQEDVLALAVDDESGLLTVEDLDGVLERHSGSAGLLSGFIIFYKFLSVKGDGTLLVVLEDPFFLHNILLRSGGLDGLLCRSSFDDRLGLFFGFSLFFRRGLGGSCSRSSRDGVIEDLFLSGGLSAPHPDVSFTGRKELVDSLASSLQSIEPSYFDSYVFLKNLVSSEEDAFIVRFDIVMAGLRVKESPPVEKKHGILYDLGVVEERAAELSALFEISNGTLSTRHLVGHEAQVCGLGAGTHGGEVGGLLVGLSDE